MDEVQSRGIVTVVGKQINLVSKVKWYNSKKLEWRNKNTLNDTLFASPIKIYFENGDNYVWPNLRGQDRGNIPLISEELKTFFDDSLRAYYSFRNFILDTSTVYILNGSFAFRSVLNVDHSKLTDTAFIRQSNDVTYWNQTFEFNLKSISK